MNTPSNNTPERPDNFEVMPESQEAYQIISEKQISLNSVAELLQMISGTSRREWQDAEGGHKGFIRKYLLEPHGLGDESWRYDEESDRTTRDFLFDPSQTPANIDVIEEIIDESMGDLMSEGEADSFTLMQWIGAIARSINDEKDDEKTMKRLGAVEKIAEMISVIGLDEMLGGNGMVKLTYAGGGMQAGANPDGDQEVQFVSDLVRDCSFETAQRIEEEGKPFYRSLANSMREGMRCSILSPRIRSKMSKSQREAIERAINDKSPKANTAIHKLLRNIFGSQ